MKMLSDNVTFIKIGPTLNKFLRSNVVAVDQLAAICFLND